MDEEILSEEERQEEFMFMGMRMSEGILENDFYSRFKTDIYDVYGRELKSLVHDGLVISENGRLYLSDRGIDVSNQIFEKFIK